MNFDPLLAGERNYNLPQLEEEQKRLSAKIEQIKEYRLPQSPQSPVWENYIDAWNIGKIGEYTVNSIYVTGMTILITIVLASMAAYILGRINFKARTFIMSFIMVGMMLPPFVIAIPLFDILGKLSLLNSLKKS